MAQGEFYVATAGPISGPILLDGFALVVRDPQTAILLVQQIRGWSVHVFPVPLSTAWGTPPIPVNVDGLLVHPRQVERDPRTLSMYFFPEESLRTAERAFLAARSTRRFLTLENRSTLGTPRQSPVPSAWLQESSIVGELVSPEVAPSPTTALSKKLLRPQPETIADLRARRIRRRRDRDD